MTNVKLAVVYYSTYGTNHQMAETAEEAAREAGAEVRLRKVRETAPDEVVKSQEAWNEQVERTADIEEATPDDLVWADAYLFSSPTRYGGGRQEVDSLPDAAASGDGGEVEVGLSGLRHTWPHGGRRMVGNAEIRPRE
jgi:NAD(P)H dehydrogenase (quinone)